MPSEEDINVGVIMLAKRESPLYLFLFLKDHNLYKKEKSYLIKYFVFTRGNKVAQNIQVPCQGSSTAQQEFLFPVT